MKRGVLAGSLLLLATSACAVQLRLSGRSSRSSLRRRGNISGIGNTTLTDSTDIQYATNITLGGSSYNVLIDTGSSDLWVVDSNVPNSQSLGISSTVTYAVGSATGPVKTAPLVFAGYNVPNQAFIQMDPSADNAYGTGLIGLGPNDGSVIFEQTNDSSVGNTVLDSLFLQNLQTPNILTILLGRSSDPSDQFPGDLTVGETVPGYDDILNQPKLSVTKVAETDGTQHLQVLLDQNGITGPDGQPIPVTSQVKTTKNKNQATVVFDSGFTLPQVPKSVSDAIYGRFPNSSYVDITGIGNVWILPCTSEVNISFTFANKTFPVHPLDATMDPSLLGISNVQTSTGESACIGSFQPMSFSGSPTYDIILGMAFLRNAYFLCDFGDFIDGGSDKGNPYIQLLSITNDTSEAHTDFVNVRLNGVDTGTTQLTGTHPGSTTTSSSDNKRRLYIIAGCAAGVLLLLVLAAVIHNGRRKNRYQTLNNPAPAAASDMYMVPPAGQFGYQGQPGYYGQPGYQGRPPTYEPVYENPFDTYRR